MNTEEQMLAAGFQKPEDVQAEEQKRKLEEIKQRMEQLAAQARQAGMIAEPDKPVEEDTNPTLEQRVKRLEAMIHGNSEERKGALSIDEARERIKLPLHGLTYRGLSMQELDERIDFYCNHRGGTQ